MGSASNGRQPQNPNGSQQVAHDHGSFHGSFGRRTTGRLGVPPAHTVCMTNTIENLQQLLETDRATISLAEAAAVLGVDKRTLSNAVRDGEIPVIRIGRRVLVKVSPLAAMLTNAA